MRRFLVSRVLAVLAVLALAGCGGGEVRDGSAPADSSISGSPGGMPATKDATFVYLDNLDIVTDWDPASSYSNEISAMQNIYDSLTVYNPLIKRAGPRLAESWTASQDGKAWTFTLRSGAVFHTGRPVDADAVKASIERTKRMAAGAAYIWDPVQKITVLDPLTVQFTLKYPAPLDLIASADYAAYIYDTEAAGSGDLKKWFQQGRDAGSGPYTVASWHKGREKELVLRAFDEYWGGWDGPHYKNVEYRVVPNQNAAWQLLLRGEASFVERLNSSLFRRAKATAGVRTRQVPSFQNMLVLFNSASGPLRDVRLRKAVQKAIDYDGVIAALKGAGDPAAGLVPEGLLGHVPGMRPRQDLERAEELLREAGYGPGGRELRLTLTYAEGDNDEQLLVTLLVNALSELNVKVDARAMQWNAQWNQAKSADPAKRQDILVMYWWPDYADAYSWFLNVFRSADPVSFNLTYLKNKDIDERIDKLQSLLATDREAAQKEYAGLQTELIDKRAVVAAPWVVNYQRAYLGNVSGYADNPAYPNVVFVHQLIPTA
ncbi:ABC transporter substrate-binding protein [Sphaerimonospora thailandensis]|uniref:Peptide ABC transporter substrate-binding protein n=1 Tax=Sphaerimonospora thailandensis TaxID=795644 RepID=A0A8J3RDM1_9ACTN|nr:ABC transporter substrate-binding protein [Sphaerimonospora thailandensis]GIH73088.1 peptide ABC transporter substrate-binding protein [Sphaerimonospora thailandensis]